MADYHVPEGATDEQYAEILRQVEGRIETISKIPEDLSLEQLKKIKEELLKKKQEEKKHKPAGGGGNVAAGGEGNLAAISRGITELLEILREAKSRGKL